MVLVYIILYWVIASFFYATQERFDPLELGDDQFGKAAFSALWPIMFIAVLFIGLSKLFLYILYKIFPERKGE